MGLAGRHLSGHTRTLQFDPAVLAARMRETCPEVVFACLMGSACDGAVKPGSDVDLALYLESPPTLDLYGRVDEPVQSVAPGAFCDVGWLHRAEPVYRFEALKGRLLFTREDETFASFFSLTCREYEEQLADYERQYAYRTGIR